MLWRIALLSAHFRHKRLPGARLSVRLFHTTLPELVQFSHHHSGSFISLLVVGWPAAPAKVERASAKIVNWGTPSLRDWNDESRT
jgi:hypothetical protein